MEQSDVMPDDAAATRPSPAATRLLDRYGDAVRTVNGKRAREELMEFITALETENAGLRAIVQST